MSLYTQGVCKVPNLPADLGRLNEAWKEAKKALELNPSDMNVRTNAGGLNS